MWFFESTHVIREINGKSTYFDGLINVFLISYGTLKLRRPYKNVIFPENLGMQICQ